MSYCYFVVFAFLKIISSCSASSSHNLSDISISFTSTSDVKYVKMFSGDFSPQSTPFKDTTTGSDLDGWYYFVSDAGQFTDRSEWPVLMQSTIYDSNVNVFSNDKNVISSQLPYQVFAANQSFLGGANGYQLFSCTNGITYDIIICYDIAENLNPMIYCLIFFNDYLTPKWSNPIAVINKTIPVDPLSFTLECLHDGYLILFQSLTPYENEKPSTLYTLLDIDGNVVINSQPLFDENVFNFSMVFPREVIQSHQNNPNSMSVNDVDTQILVSLCIGRPRRLAAFYLDYTNINDINPLSVNYAASGGELVAFRDGGITSLSGLQYYYQLDSTNNCCYMTSYFIGHHGSDPIHFYAELYVAIIDGNGNKLFKNDTLIETIDHTLATNRNATMSSQIHQLNVNSSDENNENVYYFGVVITIEQNIFVRTFYIDMQEKVLKSMETIRLINVDDLPNVGNVDDTFVDVYVDSQLKYDNNEMFFVYRSFTLQNVTNSIFVFVQSFNYSVN